MNYRGCDGYGAQYSALYNPTNGAKDVLTFYDNLVATHSDIDRDKIFLVTSSAGMRVVSELLAVRPKLWRAIGMDKCPPPDGEKIEISKLPPMITIIGTLDPLFDRVQEFAERAKAHHLDIKFIAHANAGHITYSSSDQKDTLGQIVNFFSEHME